MLLHVLVCSRAFLCVFVCFLSFFLAKRTSKEHTDIGLRTGMTCWILENLDECCMKERMAECWRTSELGLVTRCGKWWWWSSLCRLSSPLFTSCGLTCRGGDMFLYRVQAPWIFYHLQDWKKNPQDWHIILYQSPTKSSMDYFMIFETQKNPQDLQLLVAQVLSAFHMCNIMQHRLGLFLSWEMVEHCEVTDPYMPSAFKALWMVKRQQVYCSFCEQ